MPDLDPTDLVPTDDLADDDAAEALVASLGDIVPDAAPPTGPVDVRAETAAFFGADTPLKRAPEFGGRPYEERPQQAHMAAAIAEALLAGEHLCIEAPTGVGKSFAYLVPAILWARQRGLPVVVSTHTIALQEQLIDKDLPLLQHLLGGEFRPALAKGRGNYLCRTRLERALRREGEQLPFDDLEPELMRLATWAAQTTDGSLSQAPFRPGAATWAAVCSEPGVCPHEHPGARDPCFFEVARRQVWAADIIVANHALTCTDLAMRRVPGAEGGILPRYGLLILDEAHTFEEVAATHLGLRVGSYQVMLTLQRLYNPRNQRGLLARKAGEDLRPLALAARDAADDFFGRVRVWLQQQPENPVAYDRPGHIPNLVEDSWRRFLDRLDIVIRDDDLDRDWRQELRVLHTRLAMAADNLKVFLDMTAEGHVYWLELGGRAQQYVSFNAVPVQVGSILADVLFARETPVVLTSATLAIRGRFDYFRERIGLDHARELLLDSPFDFLRQVQLHLPLSEMPSPKDGDRYLPAVCDKLRHFIALSRGRAFVLFTSYRMMNEVADALAEFFANNRIPLLVQGRDLERSRMLDAFRRDVGSVIFGTDSFWTGVDVPGEALSNVIIVRLPFPVPSHPLVAARSRLLEQQGRSPFQHYFLPEAILMFRQGFGRLIRARDDTGMVVVLDSRIVRAGYGRQFLAAIPTCQRMVF